MVWSFIAVYITYKTLHGHFSFRVEKHFTRSFFYTRREISYVPGAMYVKVDTWKYLTLFAKWKRQWYIDRESEFNERQYDQGWQKLQCQFKHFWTWKIFKEKKNW